LLVTTTSNGVKHIIGTEVKTLSGDRESITITKPGLVLVEATNSVYNVEDTGNVGDTLKFIRTKNNEGWESVGPVGLTGEYDQVFTMFKDDGPTGYLYIGGRFGNINNAENTANLAKLRLGSTGPWEAVGTGGPTGVYDYVYTMFKDDGPTGYLYIGGRWNNNIGNFPNTQKLAKIRIGSTGPWEPVGPGGLTGINEGVNTMFKDELSNYLYIGGSFGNINGAENTTYLAKLRYGSTGTWEAVGPVGSTGLDGQVNTMFKDDGPTGYLYIGGTFGNINNAENTQYLAKLHLGSTGPWESVGPVGSTGPVGVVNTMFKDDDPTGYLYIGGSWNNELGNVPNTQILAKIRLGSTGPWEAVGSTGPNLFVNTIFKDDGPTGYLYIGGAWDNELGNVPNTQYLAKIRLGSTGPWEAVGSTGPNIYVNTMFRDGPTGYLYIGGNWTNELGVPNTAHLAKLPFGSTGPWEAVGSTGPDVEVYTMFKDEISNYLYIGGSWDNELGGVPNTQRLARIVEETNIIVNDKIYNIPKIGDTLEFVYANPWVKLNYSS
jgi:hypothetical protein